MFDKIRSPYSLNTKGFEMNHFLSAVGSSKRLTLCLAVLLALVFGRGSLAEAQFGSAMYVYMYGSGTPSEGSGNAMLYVDRLAVQAISYETEHFKVCFSGSAIPGTDFDVVKKGSQSPMSLSSNCFTDTWSYSTGYQSTRYYIKAKSDNISDANENIIATLSEDGGNPWPKAYGLLSYYNSVTFTISGG
ncbi:MAG: hypothetical protein OXG68_01060 [Chloroflexi bacterium]|nr:hypothetical protein [Chloroflexota bacterium]